MPVGIFGAHDVIDVAEIDGDMQCLLSRTQLQEWGATMRLGDGHIQFDKLGRAGAMDTPAHTRHLLLALMQFDMDKPQSGEELHAFPLGAEEALVNDEDVATNGH